MENNGFYIGKTLATLAKELPADFHHGYSVYLLKNEKDDTGLLVDDSYSVTSILRNHPELSEAKVKLVNDYYGMTVFRVIDKTNDILTGAIGPFVLNRDKNKSSKTILPETCDYCVHNVVCDHDKYGFETCGQFLPHFV